MLVSFADVNEVYKVSPPGSYGKKNGTTARSNMCIKFLQTYYADFFRSTVYTVANVHAALAKNCEQLQSIISAVHCCKCPSPYLAILCGIEIVSLVTPR